MHAFDPHLAALLMHNDWLAADCEVTLIVEVVDRAREGQQRRGSCRVCARSSGSGGGGRQCEGICIGGGLLHAMAC